MERNAYLKEVVNTLAQEIGVRSYRDPSQLGCSADYITRQFDSFGYPVVNQSFRFQGNDYRNIIAELRGSSAPESILVIGAHYDTVRTTPGADDNASGIAGLLGLARHFSDKPLRKTVRFVAFSLEEPPAYRTRNMGSYHYARSLKEGNELVEGMICLEMIGFFGDRKGSQHYPFPFMNLVYPREGNYIAMVGNRASRNFTRRTATHFTRATDLPAVTLNAPALVIGIDFSDHWSFNKFGYPALMVTDTAFYRNPHYHQSTDLPETLDFDRMDKVVQGLVGVMNAL